MAKAKLTISGEFEFEQEDHEGESKSDMETTLQDNIAESLGYSSSGLTIKVEVDESTLSDESDEEADDQSAPEPETDDEKVKP